MSWQLFLFSYLVLATASYLVRRSLAKEFGQYSRIINAVFFVGVLYPIGLLVAAFTSPDLQIGWANFFFALVGSGLFPIVMLLAFRANRDIDVGLYTIINNITPIVTILAAITLLSESLNTTQIIGATTIIASAFIATLPNLRSHAKSNFSGILFAVASVIVLGFAVVFERWMLSRIDFGAYLVYGWGGQALWMTILAWPYRRQIKKIFVKASRNRVIGYAFANSLKGLFFVAALQLSGSASIVSAFASFTTVLVVISAYFILKERDFLWLKLTAAIIGTTGLLILNLGSQ